MRILLPFPRHQPFGGAECVAAWSLQALREEHDLTVLGWQPPDTAGYDRTYGTSLVASEVAFRRPGPMARRLAAAFKASGADPHSVLSLSLLMRAARGLRSEYDLAFSLFGEADLGGGGLQYVHEPWTPGMRRWRPWRFVAGYSSERMRSNATLVNSRFTAGRVAAALGVRATVVHPPVPGEPARTPWEEREQGVITVGRLDPGKQLDMAMNIVAAARRERSDLHLHIAGRPDPNHRRYRSELRDRVAATGGWATLHEDLDRPGLLALIGRQRYGLHVLAGEPYGIAVGEMVRAGCLVLAPRLGGAAEIVGDERLLFGDPLEAASKLVEIAASARLCASLRSHLDTRYGNLGTTEFVQGIRTAVRRFEG